MARPNLSDSTAFWLSLAAALFAGGGAVTALAATEKIPHVWLTVGIVALIIGALAVLWGLVLFVAHRYAQSVITGNDTASRDGTVAQQVTVQLGVGQTAIDQGSLARPTGLEVVRIADLVTDLNDPVLRYLTLEEKELHGPAILAPIDNNCEFLNLTLNAPDAEAVLYPLPAKANYVGIIGMQSVTIRRCVLNGVAIMAPEPILQKFREAWQQPGRSS